MSATIKVDVKTCARCHMDHIQVEFEPLTYPSAEWTHWAMCEISKQPVMLAITSETPDNAAIDQMKAT